MEPGGLYKCCDSLESSSERKGWESQLLEMGFLAMFLSPVLSLSQFSRHTPTSWTNVWGNCWMIFRIIIGACLIKMRGDTCWRDLTCMNYHYEKVLLLMTNVSIMIQYESLV
uniref:Lipase maturation factor n=1 Tax=Amphimedon queenslandica TaxID=400682 RepID=A0A1X7TE64_AMPQE